jgi:hypothetical protein
MELDTHPDDLVAGLPERPPAAALKALTRLAPARALGAIALDWAVVAAAIALAEAAGSG